MCASGLDQPCWECCLPSSDGLKAPNISNHIASKLVIPAPPSHTLGISWNPRRRDWYPGPSALCRKEFAAKLMPCRVL